MKYKLAITLSIITLIIALTLLSNAVTATNPRCELITIPLFQEQLGLTCWDYDHFSTVYDFNSDCRITLVDVVMYAQECIQ